MTRRRFVLGAALPAAALAAVAAVVVASGGDGSGGGGDGATNAAARMGSAQVERRTLVERKEVDGTLGYDDPQPAVDRLGGTLTWLPRAGDTIRPGQRLFAVDGEPVVLMDGDVPAWRALKEGVADGEDVRQMERNLAALGYDPGTVDDDFTSSTAAAVKRWQDAWGLEETGEVELGRVAFLPGPRRIAEVQATLGATGGGGGGGGGATVAWGGGDGLQTVPIADTSGAPAATSTTPPPTTPTTGTATTPAPEGGGGSGERGGSGDATGGSGGDGTGGGGSSGTEVLSTTSTRRVVTAELDAGDQELARVGRKATVVLPDGRPLQGRIVAIGAVSGGGSDSGGGAESDPTLPLTIELDSDRGLGRLDEAPVSVELAATTRRDVLAVPVAALVARDGGGYAVRVVGTAGATREVAVEPGMFADGWVELLSDTIGAGEKVQVPR